MRALDGWACWIKEPTEVINPGNYRNRKDWYSINVQAICDGSRRFIWFSANSEGSRGDSSAFKDTELGKAIYTKFALARNKDGYYFIVADAAYAQHRSIQTPYGNVRDTAKDAFDYWQSHYRINIECAFGILQRRWGIFGRRLENSLEHSALIIGTAMALHNVIIDAQERGRASRFIDGSAARPAMQSDGLDDEAERAAHMVGRQHSQCAKRDELKERLTALGATRPAWSVGRRASAALLRRRLAGLC